MSTPQLSFGRRAPKDAPALQFSALLKGALPAPPAAVNYGSDFTGWEMLGNDTVGDCVAVTWANQRALVTTALKGTTEYPDQHQVWQFYKTQNPDFDPNGDDTNGPGSPADRGMDIQTALEYLLHTGGPDGVKAVAFAKVDYTDEQEMKLAHAIFGQVWYGVNVLKQNETEFHNGSEWKYIPGSPNAGGHSITGVGYTHSTFDFITWATQTSWSEGFRRHQVEEAWIVIWPEHFGNTEFAAGIDEATLKSDYQKITGRPLTVPGS